MSTIKNNLDLLKKQISQIKEKNKISQKIILLPVTKYATIPQIQALIKCSQTCFGENKVQDTIQKIEILTRNLEDPQTLNQLSWHLIGHLQTNKAKKAVEIYDCIQSVDSLRLAEIINNEAEKIKKHQKILLQINFAKEQTKFGFDEVALSKILPEIFLLPNLNIKGIMVIAPYTKDFIFLRSVFKRAKLYFDDLKKSFFQIEDLSMGMSHDYKIAIEEGSTLVRIGNLLLE